MKNKYFCDFKLGDNKLSDFNGIRYNPNGEITSDSTPSPKHSTLEVPNRHGQKYFKTTYDSKLITIPIFIDGDIDIYKLNRWLCKDGQQTFTYIDENGALDEKEIDVVFNKGVSFTQYWTSGFKGLASIEFVAFDPLWRIREEKDINFNGFKEGVYKSFKTKTTIEATPVIKITPTSQQDNIKIMFNDLIITLSDITREIYIDSEEGSVYELDNGIKVNKFSKYYSNGWMDLPKIKPFEYNYISVIEGQVSNITITPNSRILY